MKWSQLFRVVTRCLPLVAILLSVAACGSLARIDAVPVADEERAIVPGLPNIRYWADGDPAQFMAAARLSVEREKVYLASTGHQGALPPSYFLAISGGGENGAYGAGLLVGWTEAGTRPVFKGVTGVSTGALTAPFAFLGSAYDDKLKEVYTTLAAKDVLQPRGYLAALFDDAMADNSPLRKTIAKYFDQAMLDAIAAEHEKGRILVIGTTNLDARRPVSFQADTTRSTPKPSKKAALVREGLKALIERESARRLARLGGSEPDLIQTPRRRHE